MTEEVRKTVWYSGQVQGVGFRQSVARVAQAYEVFGWVRNLPDGRVQLIAEGMPARLERFLEDVNDVLAAHIDQADVEVGLATGEFDRFTIKL